MQQNGFGAFFFLLLLSTASSSLFVWGSDERGCLGLGAKGCVHYDPVPVGGSPGSKDLAQVECGQSHTLVLSEKGLVYQAGRAGPMSFEDNGAFSEVNVHHESISQIACGLHHCVVVNKAKNKVYSWGRGTEGQLGHGHFKDVKEPTSVAKLANRHVLDVKCGDHYTLCVCTHIDYDDAKVERQLRMARQKFQSVVGGTVAGMSHHGGKPQFYNDFCNCLGPQTIPFYNDFCTSRVLKPYLLQ